MYALDFRELHVTCLFTFPRSNFRFITITPIFHRSHTEVDEMKEIHAALKVC